MSETTAKAKKIVVTPEEVAMTPTRKIAARGTKSTGVASAAPPQPQVLELDYQSIEGSGVTFIQVNDSGEVSTIDGSILGQDIAIQGQDIAIQITGDDPAATNEEALDAPIAIAAEEKVHLNCCCHEAL